METEFDNAAALSLYESLGFIREKRLYRFYMNGKDAFRLILSCPQEEDCDRDDPTLPIARRRRPNRVVPDWIKEFQNTSIRDDDYVSER